MCIYIYIYLYIYIYIRVGLYVFQNLSGVTQPDPLLTLRLRVALTLLKNTLCAPATASQITRHNAAFVDPNCHRLIQTILNCSVRLLATE